MSKKVLVIASSPRRGGNSDLLAEQFLRGAKEAGNQAEIVYLREKKINYCSGCGACVSKPGKCSQHDDMTEILGKMLSADAIVMATPVYFYTMNAQMKTLIDRACAAYTLLTNKEMYFIMTAADEDRQSLERTLEGFRGFTSCLDGPEEKGVIYGTGAFKVGDIKASPAMGDAFEMGRRV
jgi:multimeric flavodoxin WrbA